MENLTGSSVVKTNDNFTERLREKMRSYSMTSREQLRGITVDALRFGLSEIKEKIEDLECLCEKDVTGLAKRIKRRKHATEEDMYRLSHAFLQGNENIKSFAMLPGALQVLIKELTGKQITRQLYAAECFCNLSLGEAPVCEKIASMAGSYFITYLDGSEIQLKMLSLWTIANLIATSSKASNVLLQMKLLPKLWHIYTDEEVVSDANGDCREDAGISLQLLTMPSMSMLTSEDRNFIRNNLHAKNPTTNGAEYHLLIIFNSDILKTDDINAEQIVYLINCALRNIKEVPSLDTKINAMRVIYAVRILGNLLASKFGAWQSLLTQLSNVWQDNLVNLLNKLFAYKEQKLTIEVFWLLKQIIFCDIQQNTGMQQYLLEKMIVYGPIPPFENEIEMVS